MKNKVFFILIVLICSCSKKYDFSEIDGLIKEQKYRQASEILSTIETESLVDSTDIKKYNHRLLLAKKGLMFQYFDSILAVGDSEKINQALVQIKQKISTIDSGKARWYWFDFYTRRAGLYFNNSQRREWQISAEKAVNFPTEQDSIKRKLLFDLAFYFAVDGKFVNAREWLDKAIRGLDAQAERSFLNDAYILYMNGDYKQANLILSSNSEKIIDKDWKRFSGFLSLYADSLTMENRFRLW